MSKSSPTADQVWAALNVSSIGDEFNQEQKATVYTSICSSSPAVCGTGTCNTVYQSNCCVFQP